MSVIESSRYQNPSPPDSDFEYETATVTLRPVPASVLPDEILEILNFYEDELRSLPGSDLSDMSFSDDDRQNVIMLSTQNTTVKENANSATDPKDKGDPLPTCVAPDLRLVKTEKLSDGEIPSEKKSPKKKTLKKHSQKQKNLLGIDYSESDGSDEEGKHRTRMKPEKRIKVEPEPEIERKPMQGISACLNDYYCNVCNISLNSEATYTTHLLGRRHKKALNAQNVPALAMESLSLMSEKSNQRYNYPIPSPRMKFVPVHSEPKLQPVIDDYIDGPLPGLKYVTEIQCRNEVKYYCNLCSAPCSVASIMQHLIGKNHRNSVCNRLDEKYNYRTHYGKENPDMQKRILLDYERTHGREKMNVEREVRDDSPDSAPGPSSGRYFDQPSTSQEVNSKSALLSAVEDLDMSKNDFYCKVCDSHMNNQNMWEAHIRGKRHLKNKKKVPGATASKVKSYPCPDATAHLMEYLEDEEEPIVGLDYIIETQGEAGDFYKCFVCHANTTNFDIIDHLKSMKHRVKYLETANRKGQKNDIEQINLMYDLPAYQKNELVKEECARVLNKYGPGRVTVYISKAAALREGKR